MRWSLLIGAVALLPGAVRAQVATAPAGAPGYVVSPGCQAPVQAVPLVAQPLVIPSNGLPANILSGPLAPGNQPAVVVRPYLNVPGIAVPQIIPGTPAGNVPPVMGFPSMPAPNAPGVNGPSNVRPPVQPSLAGNSAMPSMPSMNTATATPAANSPLANAAAGGTTPSLAGAAPAGGSGAVASSAPNMIGDFGVGPAAQLRGVSGSFRVPLVTRGGFKIAENESPRPQDRIFFNFNFFNNATVYETGLNTFTGASRPPGTPLASGPPNFNLYRETIGFEKTLLNGNASIGLRLPVLQKDGLGGVGIDGFGDLTIVTKYAFLNDSKTGDVISGGLVLTVPSGKSIILADNERLEAVLFQPWVGFVLNSDRLYVQGFSSLIVSTDSRDVTFWAFDLGVGYKLIVANPDGVLTSLTPTVELHANVPLEGSSVSQGDVIIFPDQVILTNGIHVGLCNRTMMTVGMAIPLAGPKPFDYELLCQFNVRF